MINVTKTFLPPQNEYHKILSRAWETGWITNRGVLVNELEQKLQSHLNSRSLIAMTNGTLPLQIAIKALGLIGEIITTPFSYVATTSSIVWEGCTPVFVDIHPDFLTINESLIEAAITENTSAILATHVFGNPCNVKVIDTIAKKHNLKVIYDAAHCFGVTYNGQSIFNYGDVSTCSFHATKLFHTGEGGALFCNPNLYQTMFNHHNFGHKGKEDFASLGINAKMSEPQAAMGLAVFPYIKGIVESRKESINHYQDTINQVSADFFQLRPDTEWNFSYFPILLKDEKTLIKKLEDFNTNGILPRRYFFPSLNGLNYVQGRDCPIAESIASRILCLPLYYNMELSVIKHIVKIINN